MGKRIAFYVSLKHIFRNNFFVNKTYSLSFVLNCQKLNNSRKIYILIYENNRLTVFQNNFLYLLGKQKIVNKKAILMEQAQNYICRFTATSKNANYQVSHMGHFTI